MFTVIENNSPCHLFSGPSKCYSVQLSKDLLYARSAVALAVIEVCSHTSLVSATPILSSLLLAVKEPGLELMLGVFF